MEAAATRLLDLDRRTHIDRLFIIQAFRANYQLAFDKLVARYETQGSSMEDLGSFGATLKDEERSRFDAWLLSARGLSQKTQPPASGRRLRI